MGGHIAVLGIFVADLVFRADRQPKIGETLIGKSFMIGPGGKGSNQAVAAAKAGGATRFISRLGDDTFADMALKIWSEAGVEPRITRDPQDATGAASIFVEDKTGNNAIIVAPGAAGNISPDDVEAEKETVSTASVFMTQLEQPVEAALRGLQIAKSGGAKTILNPAPAAELPPEIYPLCDIVTPNETEAELLTGHPVQTLEEAERAADKFMGWGVETVVITLGERGVFCKSRTGSWHVAGAAPAPVIDTTGAGDAFNGGFAVGLAEGKTLLQAVRFGCATAGISVTRTGTAGSMPDRAEIDDFLQSQAVWNDDAGSDP